MSLNRVILETDSQFSVTFFFVQKTDVWTDLSSRGFKTDCQFSVSFLSLSNSFNLARTNLKECININATLRKTISQQQDRHCCDRDTKQ